MSAPVTEIQSEGFTPHGIYDFRTGLNLQREPWLSPENAWEEITNGYVFRGRAHKRFGYTEFSRLGSKKHTETFITSNGSPQDIESVSDDTPVRVLCAGHGYSNGDNVQILDSQQPELNGRNFIVANESAAGFDLTTEGGVNEDGTGRLNGSAEGTVTLVDFKLTAGALQSPILPRLQNFSDELPDPYRVKIYDESVGGAGEYFDVPTNIDGVAGLIVQERTVVIPEDGDFSVGFIGSSQISLDAGGGGFDWDSDREGYPLVGMYYDDTSGLDPVVDFENLDRFTVITDPNRELPVPAPIAFVDTAPAEDVTVLAFPFGGTVNSHYFIEGNGNVRQSYFPDPSSTANSFFIWGDLPPTKGFYFVRFDPALSSSAVSVTFWAVAGTINYQTGAIDMVFIDAPNGPIKVEYEADPMLPVMGIHSFYNLDGNETLVALNKENIWKFDTSTDQRFEIRGSGALPVPVADWTGGDTDFYDFTDFEGLLFINNGKDPPKKFDPATGNITAAGVIFDKANNFQIQAASLCLRHKNRIIYFNTKEGEGVEGGTDFRNRARWSPVNSVEWLGATDAAADDFVDAPVEDSIISAITVGEEIIVGFERSWWRLRYTGDANLAFKWEPLLSEEGASGLNSIAQLPERIFARGEKSLVSVDSVSQRPADQLIPELTSTWNSDARHQSNSHYSKELREILMTYADMGADTADSVLATHVDETRTQYSYSIYEPDTPWNCFGTFRQTEDRTHNTTFLSHNQLVGQTYNDTLGASGTPLVLVGDRAGRVWSYGDGYKDHLADVKATFRTKRLNPTPFFRCHLGWIDIICDAVAGATLTVKVGKDYSTGFYVERSISLAPEGSSAKIKRRIAINKVANFHTVGLEITSGGPFKLDALVLYTRPAGMMRDIG